MIKTMKSDTREAKKVLNQIGIFEVKIRNLETEIAVLNYKMGDAKTMSFDPRVGTNGNFNTKSPQEMLLERINSYEIELENLKRDYIHKRQEIVKNILKLSDRDMHAILYNRYVLLWGWKKIIDELGYSKGHMFRLHDSGIEEFSKILKNETK